MSFTGENTAVTLLLLAPVALFAAFLLFIVLRFLQRRLRIFTRGSIAFMLVCGVVFAVTDTFLILHEIRNDEITLKRYAERNLAVDTARSLFSGAEESLVHLSAEQGESTLETLRFHLENQLSESGSRDVDLDAWQLVALSVDRHFPLSRHIHLGRDNAWRFAALIECRGDVRKIEGQIVTFQDADDVAHVARVDGDVRRGSSDEYQVLFRNAASYRNPAYSWVPGRGLIRQG